MPQNTTAQEPLKINPDRIELDEAYMQMAEIWSKRSKAVRKQVGALLVNNRRVISDGYNGMPSGSADDVCEYRAVVDGADVLVTKADTLHAESNALMKLAESGAGGGAKGGTMYVSLSPCRECAKLIKQAGIVRVVFREQYRDVGGVDLLRSLGIKVEQLPPKNGN